MAETTPGQPGQRPLPPGLDLLWGRRERGKRGPRPGLSPDAIVSAAMRLADAEGLDAVSMARVAAELGSSTMALYRHVASKEELLQLMWNGSAVGAEKLVLEGDDWRARIRHWSVIQRDMIDRHPWITQMPMAAPPAAPNSLHFVELGLAAMDGSGLTDTDALRVVGLLSSYTLSEARLAADAVRAANAAAATAAELDGNGDGDPRSQEDITREVMDSYEALLREVVDERTYPHLYRIAWKDPRPGPSSEREQFLWGVDMILDGVQALIDRTRSRPEAS